MMLWTITPADLLASQQPHDSHVYNKPCGRICSAVIVMPVTLIMRSNADMNNPDPSPLAQPSEVDSNTGTQAYKQTLMCHNEAIVP